jgi:hypothetical protein
MFRIRSQFIVVSIGLLLSFPAISANTQAPTAGAVQSNSVGRANSSHFYTTYFFGTGYTYVNLVVCGSTRTSEGCYGSASLGPFGHAGALIEGQESQPSRGVTTRDIYVVDEAAGDGTGVTLYVYKKTVTVDAPYATVAVNLTSTVPLPLTGGTGSNTFVAADDGYLFIGTDQSPFAVRVDKSDLSFGEIGGFEPAADVSSITANDKGYVTVTFGDTGFYAYDPNGYLDEDGGGAEYVVNSSSGLTTGTTSTTNLFAVPRLHVKLKHATTGASSGG